MTTYKTHYSTEGKSQAQTAYSEILYVVAVTFLISKPLTFWRNKDASRRRHQSKFHKSMGLGGDNRFILVEEEPQSKTEVQLSTNTDTLFALLF